MREQKYRALNRETGQWHYGVAFGRDFEVENVWSMPTFWLMFERGDLDPETLGQGIGLKDKNGTEVYEGDCPGGVFGECYIGYCERFHSVELMYPGWCSIDNPCGACAGDVHWYEVVHNANLEISSNIYENKALLEE